MAVDSAEEAKKARKQLAYAFLFCVVGVVLNVGLAQFAAFFNLPLFLDSAGTIIASILGGFIPGIVVGYATNLVNSISDPITLYYGVLNVLIAVVATVFAQRGWFKKPIGVIGAIFAFAAIGGGLGSVLTWLMHGQDFGTGLSATFARFLYDSGFNSVFGAQLCADLAIDLLDKSATVAFVLIFIQFVPERYINYYDFRIWKQTPLTDEQLKRARNTQTRGASLGTRIVGVVLTIMIVVALVTTAMSFGMYHGNTISEQTKTATSAANLAATEIDADRVQEFIEKGHEAAGYDEIEARLSAVRDNFPDIQYVYVYQIREDGCHVVFDPDTEDTPGYEPGEVQPFDESFEEFLPALLAGEEIEPLITNDSYGWLLTVYRPIYDSEGTCVCYACVDISMDRLLSEESVFLVRLISMFGAFFILVCALALWLAEYRIILPVNTIAYASRHFAFDSADTRSESVESIRSLDVHTGDEIESLYEAVAKTSEDTVEFIAEAAEKSATIERMQHSLIAMMADLIESRDHYTGNHVRNTAAYTRIIMDEMRKEDLYPDVLTDEFMDNVYNSAPLHDVGKISVSDTILNKPGKLTPEEFDEMKNHTLAGREIIGSVAQAVSESGYLEEAENMATYHHEKWNGTGYPYGVEGEEIPLSARIMAVADVFDALVSRRSYKEGMPVDKALSIIEEGMGTHFDPVVAQAFLNAQEEARAVALESNANEAERQHVSLTPEEIAAIHDGRR